MTKARSSEKNIYFTPVYKNATVTGSRLFSVISLQKHNLNIKCWPISFSPAVWCWSVVTENMTNETPFVPLLFKTWERRGQKRQNIADSLWWTAAGSNFSCKVSAVTHLSKFSWIACWGPHVFDLLRPPNLFRAPFPLHLAHEVSSEKKRFLG